MTDLFSLPFQNCHLWWLKPTWIPKL